MLGKYFNHYVVDNSKDFNIILEQAQSLGIFQPNMVIYGHDEKLSPYWSTYFPDIECPPAAANLILQYINDPSAHVVRQFFILLF